MPSDVRAEAERWKSRNTSNAQRLRYAKYDFWGMTMNLIFIDVFISTQKCYNCQKHWKHLCWRWKWNIKFIIFWSANFPGKKKMLENFKMKNDNMHCWCCGVKKLLSTAIIHVKSNVSINVLSRYMEFTLKNVHKRRLNFKGSFLMSLMNVRYELPWPVTL